jgi:hypothetical protein
MPHKQQNQPGQPSVGRYDDAANIKPAMSGDSLIVVKSNQTQRFVVAAHHRTSLRQSTPAYYLINVKMIRVFQQNRSNKDPRKQPFTICSSQL